MDSYILLTLLHFMLSVTAFESIDEMVRCYIIQKQIKNKELVTHYHITKLKESKMGIFTILIYLYCTLSLGVWGLYIYSFYSFFGNSFPCFYMLYFEKN